MRNPSRTDKFRTLVLFLATATVLFAACSPPPPTAPPPQSSTAPATPLPSLLPSATPEAVGPAALAYSTFVTSWTAQYADLLNAGAAAADSDPSLRAQYATDLAAAYHAYAEGVSGISFPQAIQPAVSLEVQTLTVVIGLAEELAIDPANAGLDRQLQAALARVAESSSHVEALLGISN